MTSITPYIPPTHTHTPQDPGSIDMLIRLMGLSLGEPMPAYSKREAGKETFR